MRVQRTLISSVLFLLMLGGNTQAQFRSIGVDWKDTLYRPDSLFVIHQTSTNLTSGHFVATSPDGGNGSFEWSKYDTISHTFSTPFETKNDVLSSDIYISETSGYNVHITNLSGYDTTIRFWVLIDTLQVTADKDENGEVPYFQSHCDFIDFGGQGYSTNFKFRNFETGKDSIFNNYLSYQWSADPELDYAITSGGPKKRIYSPPYKDTKFTLTAADRFGMKKTDDVQYISIVPHADFDTIVPTTSFLGQLKHSAPLTVKLTNKSENATKFTWYIPTIDTFYTEQPDSFVLKLSGTYKVKLVAEKLLCIDSITKQITVDPPQILDSVNIFFPDRGGEISIFKLDNISLSYINITIVSRYGKIVYQWAGPAGEWTGWDGTIRHSSTKASAGVYYYYLAVQTFDRKPQNIASKGVYKGFVYLVRDN